MALAFIEITLGKAHYVVPRGQLRLGGHYSVVLRVYLGMATADVVMGYSGIYNLQRRPTLMGDLWLSVKGLEHFNQVQSFCVILVHLCILANFYNDDEWAVATSKISHDISTTVQCAELTMGDPWPIWPIGEPTDDPRDPWPITNELWSLWPVVCTPVAPTTDTLLHITEMTLDSCECHHQTYHSKNSHVRTIITKAIISVF